MTVSSLSRRRALRVPPVRPPQKPAPISVSDAPEAAPALGLRLLIVLAAMIGAVLEVLDTSITNVAIPQMQGNLGATLSEIGWVNTGYIISNVVVLPMTGWLADRFGRKRYFAGSVALFTLASFFCGTSHSLGELIFWRLVQGAGGGGLLSVGQVIMLQAFPKNQQGIATALFGMGVMVGPSLGPVLGGWLTDNLSWPWIFFINIPFGIAGFFLALAFVPDGARKQAGPIDIPGIALLAVGLGALQTALERGQEEDWFSSRFIVTLSVLAVAGLSAFVAWELTTKHPIVNLRLLRNRSLAAGSLFGFVLGLGLYATIYLLPVFLQSAQGYTAYATGMALLPSALLSMVSFLSAGSLSQKADTRLLLLIGSALFVLGAWGLSGLASQSGVDDTYWPLMARGAALGYLFIPLTVASLGGLKPQEMGEGSGFINLTRQLGGSIGIAAFSTLLVRRADFHRASLVSHLTDGNSALRDWTGQAESRLRTQGLSASDAHGGALGLLNSLVQRQALMLSFNDAYLLIGLAFVLALPLLLVFKKGASTSEALPAGH